MIAKVVFSVGIKHPLYGKEVLAEILSTSCGYDGRRTYARTVEDVFWPEDKEGILVYRDGVFVGYKTKEAHREIWEGYCKIVVEDEGKESTMACDKKVSDLFREVVKAENLAYESRFEIETVEEAEEAFEQIEKILSGVSDTLHDMIFS